jgi:hypothetical protein
MFHPTLTPHTHTVLQSTEGGEARFLVVSRPIRWYKYARKALKVQNSHKETLDLFGMHPRSAQRGSLHVEEFKERVVELIFKEYNIVKKVFVKIDEQVTDHNSSNTVLTSSSFLPL